MESQNTTNKGREGYRLDKGEGGKSKFWCDKCPYMVESANKNAIRRHLKTQHSIKTSPMTKREIKK